MIVRHRRHNCTANNETIMFNDDYFEERYVDERRQVCILSDHASNENDLNIIHATYVAFRRQAFD
jgi:hypothetical protein